MRREQHQTDGHSLTSPRRPTGGPARAGVYVGEIGRALRHRVHQPLLAQPERAAGPVLSLSAEFTEADPIFSDSQRRDLVRELHERAVKRDPGLWQSRLVLALSHAEREGMPEAVREVKRLVDEFPRVPAVLSELARLYAELRWNPRGPWLIEVAGRSIGGLCSKTLRFGLGGASLEELILKQALGLGFEPAAPPFASGVLMIPIPRGGILRAVHGEAAARRVPLVEGVEITARLHYPLVPLPEGDSYLGFAFARGGTAAEVEAALRAAHACLRFEIASEVGLQPVS